jgi:mannose-6-phosphate isomerase-like protein (cupin superfamily)
LKLRITSRARSSLVNATLAIAATSRRLCSCSPPLGSIENRVDGLEALLGDTSEGLKARHGLPADHAEPHRHGRFERPNSTASAVRQAKDSGSPLHVHHRESEWFYVLDGELIVWVGGQAVRAPAGSFVFGPQGTPHTFTVSAI